MKWFRVLPLLLLALIALALATAARDRGRTSELPSVLNHGPKGVAAVFALLEASGAEVRSTREPLDLLPPETRTLVLVAPAVEKMGSREVRVLRDRVRNGLRFVYFTPRPMDLQPALAEWLGLSEGPWLPTGENPGDHLADLGGTTAAVWSRSGWLGNSGRLRLSLNSTVSPETGAWVPVAGVHRTAGAWARREGLGEVWVFAGPELAENTRLPLLDNAAAWLSLAADGPIVFDERFHFRFPVPIKKPLLWAAVLQLIFCGALFAWSRGVRLGPPREPPPQRHRGSREYLDAIAALLRRGRIEQDLVLELVANFRRTVSERLGLGQHLPEHEVAAALEQRLQLPRVQTEDFFAASRRAAENPKLSLQGYARLAREAAQLEAAITRGPLTEETAR